MSIPVIDIFAGPGGLGEGFSSVMNEEGERFFNTVLSIEMDEYAHETLELRSFFRQFAPGKAPEEYYKFLRQEIDKEELFKSWPEQEEKAKNEAWNIKLGFDESSVTPDEVDRRIRVALNNEKKWVLIGGPRCQEKPMPTLNGQNL
ncbi:MAG: DNA cytosine methyltransferase [Candidatus Marinimicrobia bacterium]|nr:DNA cytosine methyltransferase [Candidatus Neomarinimicrobiota bacterium]MCF7827789.1 DNA cytosine methyltransferase [Candidatus Neomarinimicrobiota bacterium]MCF7879456.1 DNA cytosine methyltransferase [Candidatus Neomarinimicrobiota bacterium]